MRVLLLGRRSMLAFALAKRLQKEHIPFQWISYAEVKTCDSAFFYPFTHLINCIAYTDVERAEEQSEIAEEMNIHFLDFLVGKVNPSQCKIIHYSTDYVFDGNSSLMYDEDAATHPLNVYGQTKRIGEERLMERAPNALIIRTSWLYGLAKKNFVTAIIHRMREEEKIHVVNDQIGTSTLTDDLAWATLKLTSQKGVVHFANKGVKSRFEWASVICDMLRQMKVSMRVKQIVPICSHDLHMQAPRPPFSALDTGKFTRITGITPRDYLLALQMYLSQLFKRGDLC